MKEIEFTWQEASNLSNILQGRSGSIGEVRATLKAVVALEKPFPEVPALPDAIPVPGPGASAEQVAEYNAAATARNKFAADLSKRMKETTAKVSLEDAEFATVKRAFQDEKSWRTSKDAALLVLSLAEKLGVE